MSDVDFTSLKRFICSMAVGLVLKCRVLQIVGFADGRMTFYPPTNPSRVHLKDLFEKAGLAPLV